MNFPKVIILSITACFGMGILSTLQAQDEERYIKDQSISLILDQDAFAPAYNEDRNYTMGFSLGYTGKIADKNYLVFPWMRKGMDWLFGLKGQLAHGEEYMPGMALFISGFTPEDISQSGIVDDDRPYGSLLSISSSMASLLNGSEDEISQSALSTRLNIGVLGTGLANSVQSYIHKEGWLGSTRPIPEGWHNQVSDGGEPTFLYQIQYTKPGFISYKMDHDGYPTKRKMFELIYQVESNIGYYTNLAGGVVFRIGNYSTPFWYMNSAGMSSANQAPSLIADQFEFFFSLGIRGRAVVYNGLLQGQFRNSVYTLSAHQINPLILESELNIVLRYKKLSLIYYPFQLRTAEFALPTSRTHIWGGVTALFSW